MFLKKIIDSIADVGKSLLTKPFSGKRTVTALLELSDDLISYKGIASGIAIARELSVTYQALNLEDKKLFFQAIDKKIKTKYGFGGTKSFRVH